MKLVETVMAKRKRQTGITTGNRKKLAKTEGFHVGDFVWAKLPSLSSFLWPVQIDTICDEYMYEVYCKADNAM